MKNLDVLLIVPPNFRLTGVKTSASIYPLGLLTISSILNAENIYTNIYNAEYLKGIPEISFEKIGKAVANINLLNNFEDYPLIWKEIKDVLFEKRPKIVGITSRSGDVFVLQLSSFIKSILPETYVIVGGIGPSCDPEQYYYKDIDFVVIGEGEVTALELTKNLLNLSNKNLEDISGILFKKEGKPFYTSPRKLIENLDKIPFPNYEQCFYVLDNKIIYGIPEDTGYILCYSRGCPYSCSFCSTSSVWHTKKPRFRTINNLIDEIYNTKLKWGVEGHNFFIGDDLFTLNHDRVIEFCNKVKNLNVKWSCFVSVGTLERNLIIKMKESGCNGFVVGVESGSDRILKFINKKTTVQEIKEKAKLLNELNAFWACMLIIGFPTETAEEIESTINLINELEPSSVDINIYTPLPNTQLHYYLVSKGYETKIKNTIRSFIDLTSNWTGTVDDNTFQNLVIKSLRTRDDYVLRKFESFQK